jgi:hypothetical protein
LSQNRSTRFSSAGVVTTTITSRTAKAAKNIDMCVRLGPGL